jgi:phosphodiesterase/alkaline phosphatase D-like protein
MLRFRILVGAVVLAIACVGVALAASSPTVSTGKATSVKMTSAVLNGTVNPNGARTTYYFAWGPTSALGQHTAQGTLAAGTKAVSVKTTLKGLTPGSPYHYQLVASNSGGTSYGSIRTLHTTGNPPPGAQTGAASAVGRYSVTLTGVVSPQNASTTWTFEYGLTTAYGLQTAAQTVSSGTTPVTVSKTIQGLEPGTVFHYRLVAFHGNQSSQTGQDAIFMTLPLHRPAPHLSASVTPLLRRRLPATFTVRGHIVRPKTTPAVFACTGQVRVTYLLARRTVRSGLAPLHGDCTYVLATTFHRLPGHGPRGRTVRLTVRAHFNGNRYVAPGSARSMTVRLR